MQIIDLLRVIWERLFNWKQIYIENTLLIYQDRLLPSTLWASFWVFIENCNKRINILYFKRLS